MKYLPDNHYLERLKQRIGAHAKKIECQTQSLASGKFRENVKVSDEKIERVIAIHEQLSGVPSPEDNLFGSKVPIRQTLKQYFKDHRLDIVSICIGLFLSFGLGWTTEELVRDMWYSTMVVHFLFYLLTCIFIFVTSPHNNPFAKLFAFVPFFTQMFLLMVASKCLNIPFGWTVPLIVYLVGFIFVSLKDWFLRRRLGSFISTFQCIINLIYFGVIGVILFFMMFVEIWGSISDIKQFALLMIFTLLMSLSMFTQVIIGWHRDNPDKLFQSALDPLNQGIKFILLGVFSGYALVFAAILLFWFLFTHVNIFDHIKTNLDEKFHPAFYVFFAVVCIGWCILKVIDNPSNITALNTGWGYALIYVYLFWPLRLVTLKQFKF